MLNADGTPYITSGSNTQFDPLSTDFALFNLWDQEAIKQGGSPIYYYEVYISTNVIDPIYLEARDKLYSPIPIELWCVYEPIPSQNYMSAFGFDSPSEMIFELNYADVLKKVGHPPKLGSRIHTPHLAEDWVIKQKQVGEFKKWGALRLQILCQKFQESMTTSEGKVTSKRPDYNLNNFGNP